MTATIGLASRLVNGFLSVKPLADLAKYQARNMMIKRAEKIGVPWRENVNELRAHNWEEEFNQVNNSGISYPEYYLRSFHAYEQGNLSWDAALEVESASYAVHAKLWSEGDSQGDYRLRKSFHDIVTQQIPISPANILDLGCSVGMSTVALQETYPQAKVTGLDLSPYFLAVAQYRTKQENSQIEWIHNPAESTGFADNSFDLVSACLIFHELPQVAAKAILEEAHRLLTPGGYLTIMDMNPGAEAYKKMPPYILTLLKSTEPYLDQYFSLDLEQAIIEAGFKQPTITPSTPRHRTVIAQVNK